MMRQVVVGGLKDLRDQRLIIEWTFLTRNMRRSQTVKGDWLLLGVHLCGRHPAFMASECERQDEDGGSNTSSHWTRTFSGWFITQTLVFFLVSVFHLVREPARCSISMKTFTSWTRGLKSLQKDEVVLQFSCILKFQPTARKRLVSVSLQRWVPLQPHYRHASIDQTRPYFNLIGWKHDICLSLV